MALFPALVGHALAGTSSRGPTATPAHRGPWGGASLGAGQHWRPHAELLGHSTPPFDLEMPLSASSRGRRSASSHVGFASAIATFPAAAPVMVVALAADPPSKGMGDRPAATPVMVVAQAADPPPPSKGMGDRPDPAKWETIVWSAVAPKAELPATSPGTRRPDAPQLDMAAAARQSHTDKLVEQAKAGPLPFFRFSAIGDEKGFQTEDYWHTLLKATLAERSLQRADAELAAQTADAKITELTRELDALRKEVAAKRAESGGA